MEQDRDSTSTSEHGDRSPPANLARNGKGTAAMNTAHESKGVWVREPPSESVSTDTAAGDAPHNRDRSDSDSSRRESFSSEVMADENDSNVRMEGANNPFQSHEGSSSERDTVEVNHTEGSTYSGDEATSGLSNGTDPAPSLTESPASYGAPSGPGRTLSIIESPGIASATPGRLYEPESDEFSSDAYTDLNGSSISRFRSWDDLSSPSSTTRESGMHNRTERPSYASFAPTMDPIPDEDIPTPGPSTSHPAPEDQTPETSPAQTTKSADILTREKLLINICRALIDYGAPSHRLEEYLQKMSTLLDIKAQFLYLPDCMHISFDNILTHTSSVQFVRAPQSINLYKLKQIHEIYKAIMHKTVSVSSAITKIESVVTAKNTYPLWACILMYGLASGAISSLFKSRLIDVPVIIVLGMLLGTLHLLVAPRSKTYDTVFEVSATILVTFLARCISSIQGGDLFCFSAIAQASIAIILPGYLMLTAALELQSKAIVPGSIRLVYSVLYLMFLSYGVTVGTAAYGAVDRHAVTEMVCRDAPAAEWGYLWVSIFTILISATFQARWSQMPVMVVVSVVGYMINSYTSRRFVSFPAIAATCSAFVIGVLANLYSRVSRGIAVTAILPAVYVLVPGGLASSGAITGGLMTAASFGEANSTMPNPNDTRRQNTLVFDVTASMLQIGIGLTVGLFLSAWVIYPMGKRRSGLWSL